MTGENLMITLELRLDNVIGLLRTDRGLNIILMASV